MFVFCINKRKLVYTSLAVALLLCGITIGILAAAYGFHASAQGRRLPIYSVDRPGDDKKIAVTFDAAWENSDTDELIEVLAKHQAKATFFVTGDWVDRCQEDLKKLYDAGHEIGNHSDQHPHVAKINTNDLIADTKACYEKIKQITGEGPSLYRGPYGEYSDSMLTTIEGMGYKVIQWSVDSLDWKKPSLEQMVEKVVSKAQNGSIVLFHTDTVNTPQALDQILTQLTQQGYSFVRVSDLIYHNDYYIDANGVQHPAAQQKAVS